MRLFRVALRLASGLFRTGFGWVVGFFKISLGCVCVWGKLKPGLRLV